MVLFKHTLMAYGPTDRYGVHVECFLFVCLFVVLVAVCLIYYVVLLCDHFSGGNFCTAFTCVYLAVCCSLLVAVMIVCLCLLLLTDYLHFCMFVCLFLCSPARQPVDISFSSVAQAVLSLGSLALFAVRLSQLKRRVTVPLTLCVQAVCANLALILFFHIIFTSGEFVSAVTKHPRELITWAFFVSWSTSFVEIAFPLIFQ